MEIEENVPLAPLTTLKVGGPARYFAEARNAEEVKQAVAYAQAHNYPLFILGGGSNLVIADAGWPGMVLKIGIQGINHRHGRNQAIFEAGAGEDWDGFVALATTHRCAGIECLSGIPGSVGGTPVQNVGAYGQEVADTIQSVQVLDLQSGEECELSKEECGFGYRTSIFNTTSQGRYIVLQVNYSLTPHAEPRIVYADLKKYFAASPSPPTLTEVRQAVLNIRAGKAMVITPGDDDCRSAGSFFKNPVLSAEQFQALEQRCEKNHLRIPSYPAGDSLRKISAAWLVENSGFPKGFIEGRVGISKKHSLAIVNRGGASAAEIVALKGQIRNGVELTWGVRLEAEPVFVGF